MQDPVVGSDHVIDACWSRTLAIITIAEPERVLSCLPFAALRGMPTYLSETHANTSCPASSAVPESRFFLSRVSLPVSTFGPAVAKQKQDLG